MKHYRWTHAIATAFAAAAVSYQTAVIWETMAAVSVITRLGVPLATSAAAMMPVLAEAAWRHGERVKSLLMAIPVAVLLAYVLPSGISRLGEAQESRIAAATMGADDLARLRADLATADKLVSQAQKWVADECKTGAGRACKGQQFTLAQRTAYKNELVAKLESQAPITQPWLPVWQPALLPIGLELSIVVLMFYGMGPLTHVARRRNDDAPAQRPAVAITERDFDNDPVSDDELAEIKRLLGQEGLMNKELARRLGVSEGQCSKIVTAAIADGKLSKAVDPANRRAVMIRAA